MPARLPVVTGYRSPVGLEPLVVGSRSVLKAPGAFESNSTDLRELAGRSAAKLQFQLQFQGINPNAQPLYTPS